MSMPAEKGWYTVISLTIGRFPLLLPITHTPFHPLLSLSLSSPIPLRLTHPLSFHFLSPSSPPFRVPSFSEPIVLLHACVCNGLCVHTYGHTCCLAIHARAHTHTHVPVKGMPAIEPTPSWPSEFDPHENTLPRNARGGGTKGSATRSWYSLYIYRYVMPCHIEKSG